MVNGKRGGVVSRISLVIALALAGVLLYLAFRGVDWSAMLRRLAQGQLDLLALAFLTFTGSYSIRALRWRLLLSADRRVAPLTVFWGIVVGYLGNNFLPARAGELIRSALLARKTGISVSFVLATALVERVLDVVALVLIGFAAVATLSANVPVWLVAATRVMAVLAVVGLAVFVALPRLERPMQRLLTRILGERDLTAKVSVLLAQFLLGMRAFQHRTRGAGFAGLTVVIWLADSFSFIVVARAFNLTLTLPEALLLLAALGLSSAAPSTPGYVGIYQFVAVTVLAPFGFSRDAALAYIIAAQAVIYLVVIVWGTLGLWALGFRRGQAVSPAAPATPAAPTAQASVPADAERGAQAAPVMSALQSAQATPEYAEGGQGSVHPE